MKHIVAVGATSGLGGVFAEMAWAHGDRVSVLALPPKKNGNHFPCDITKTDEMKSALDEACRMHGRIDGLVFFQRYRGDGDPWHGEIAVQLTGIRDVMATMRFCPPASIVFVSSATAACITRKMSDGYHVAKAALVQFARYYAVQLGGYGVRVNCVCPGSFIKPENKGYYEFFVDERKRLASASPLGRMGTAEEVANAILWLLSDKSSFVTGTALVVDGGVSCRWQEDLVQ